MFAEVRDFLSRLNGNGYDRQIVMEIRACVIDLTSSAEIVLPGVVDVEIDRETGVITDNSTMDDEFAIKTIAIWCDKEIGNPPNYSNLQAAYEAHKGQMKLSKRYKGGWEECGS